MPLLRQSSATLDTLELEDIFVNGERVTDVNSILKIIEFNDINGDGHSTGKGNVEHMILDGKTVL